MPDTHACGHDHKPNPETIRAMMEGRDLPPSQPAFRFVNLSSLFADLNAAEPSAQQQDFEDRWLVMIDYRHDEGLRRKTFTLDELSDLDTLIEAGPHYDTVGKITITRINHATSTDLTVEQAAAL